MKKIILAFGVIFLLAAQSNAQSRGGGNYKTAIGVRVNPWLIGFTAKHFLSGPHALEGIISHEFTNNTAGNVTLTGLYEYHFNPFPHPEWNLFAGGGVHAGVYRDYYWDGNGRKVKNDSEGIVGLDGIFGVEYTFKNIPLTLQGDVKPFVNFTGGHDYYGERIFGASARYTF
ncbi:hypothetical protein COR50_20850 [Chitinophaga caeni]|uniref:Outer membrane protein beta-barrel domain-containing protein n=1 Tax=Chitinophaga caeni TaxID=2029983 RepID=A0A291QZL0_9BACT|nr:hypothetical protein [Chitinophaga caeni]ATL49426.1 hypothetical protein COR50_20850 [Chitinophaga caeni]